MNRSRLAWFAVLALGVSSLVFAQDQDRPRDPAPADTPHNVAPPRPDDTKAPKAQEQDVDRRNDAKADHEQKPDKESAKPSPAQTTNARPAGKSAHIPKDKFKANFGQQHKFVVKQVVTQQTIVAGQTQFVYSGYTFIIMDPWPTVWAYTDDCYIDYINDQYVIVDVLHPGIYITLFVMA